MGKLKTFISKLFVSKHPAWADIPESLKIKTALRTSGVTIGASDGQLLIDTSMTPVGVLGPCRSGKTTGIVIPTLLTWRESAIVIDLRGEMYCLTEHWRRTGANNKVRRLMFGDPNSPETFNFLEAIPHGSASELADIQALAAALLGEKQGVDDYLHHHAHSLLTLFIIAKRSNVLANMHDVQQVVSDNEAFAATIATYLYSTPDNELDRAAKAAAMGYAGLDGKALMTVQQTVVNSLSIFASPNVVRNTMRSSFNLDELRDGDSAMTLYLTIDLNPVNLVLLSPLIRAFLVQVVRHSAQEQKRSPKHRQLLVLDEFLALGKLPFLDRPLANLSDRGIKLLLTIQSVGQPKESYGTENGLWAQCGIRIVLQLRVFHTAENIAQEIAGIVARAESLTADELHQRPITPDELLHFGKSDTIILGVAAKPIHAQILPYYEDAALRALVKAGNES